MSSNHDKETPKANRFITFDYSEFKKVYEELFPTMKAYMEKQGWITPKNAWEMTDLFMERAFDNEEYGEVIIALQRGDFKDFHRMIEARLNGIKSKRTKPKPNEFGEEIRQKGMDNEPLKKEILNTAAKIIIDSNNPLSFYQTQNGDANSRIYNHGKLMKINNGNKRRWIREAMKDGTLKKMLATDGHGMATE